MEEGIEEGVILLIPMHKSIRKETHSSPKGTEFSA